MLKLLLGFIAGMALAIFLMRKELFEIRIYENGLPDIVDASLLNLINDYDKKFDHHAIRRADKTPASDAETVGAGRRCN